MNKMGRYNLAKNQQLAVVDKIALIDNLG